MHFTFPSSKTCHSLSSHSTHFLLLPTIQYTLHHPHYSSNSLIPFFFLPKPHISIQHTHLLSYTKTHTINSQKSLLSSFPHCPKHTHTHILFSLLPILFFFSFLVFSLHFFALASIYSSPSFIFFFL
jgi:hypothetical protein